MFTAMNRSQITIFFSILIFGLCLRTVNISSPPTLIFDEAHYIPPAQFMGGLAPNPNGETWKSIEAIHKSPDPNFIHPSGSKFLILAGIRLFGNDPFGWRFFSMLFGMASLILFFHVTSRLLSSVDAGLMAMFLLSTDFLHIVQSRIAMIDMFLFFFTVAVFGFVALLTSTKSKSWLLLGVIIAAGTSIKYVFALWAGLALLYIVVRHGIKKIESWVFIIKAGIFSVLLYSLWGIYYVSADFSFANWIQLHFESVTRTTDVLKFHQYGSHPSQWIFNSKAIWYAFELKDDIYRGILGFGNPVLWLAFIPLSYHTFTLIRGKVALRDLPLSKEFFSLLWFVVVYAPLYLLMWKRQGYIYYMLPAVAPMTIVVCQSLMTIKNRKVLYAFFGLNLTALIFFLPTIMFLPMTNAWYSRILYIIGP
jgi:dolichyl-phosphate-mannose-protein mannosyltransferase